MVKLADYIVFMTCDLDGDGSLPILILAETRETMVSIETIADKINVAKHKAIIVAFLGALFLIIPAIGSVSSVVTDINAVLDLVATASNLATDIYTIVDDIENAP